MIVKDSEPTDMTLPAMYHGVRYEGKTRRSLREPWRRVICHVTYGNSRVHLNVVEHEFQWHLRLDLDEMRKNYSDHFDSPHNVARAIMRFHYFREHSLFFEPGSWNYIAFDDIPERVPDREGNDFRLWLEFPEG